MLISLIFSRAQPTNSTLLWIHLSEPDHVHLDPLPYHRLLAILVPTDLTPKGQLHALQTLIVPTLNTSIVS